MAAVIAIFLFVAFLGMAALPLFLSSGDAKESGPGTNGRVTDLEGERDAVVDAMREVDFDKSLGRLSTEEHVRLRGELERRAVDLLRALEAVAPAPEDEGRA